MYFLRWKKNIVLLKSIYALANFLLFISKNYHHSSKKTPTGRALLEFWFQLKYSTYIGSFPLVILENLESLFHKNIILLLVLLKNDL